MILSSELLQTPSRKTQLKGSKKCKQKTKQDPVWENEVKITQSSYSGSKSSLKGKAQSTYTSKQVTGMTTPKCARGISGHQHGAMGHSRAVPAAEQAAHRSSQVVGRIHEDARGLQAAMKSSVQHV